MTDFRRRISENITYEESERRLIVIGSIFALCCLLVSTVFVIWIIRIYGKFITPRLISVQSKILMPSGLPSPYLLIVSDTGDMVEFSYHQKKFNLGGLPNLKMLPHKPNKNIYAFEHHGAIYFLSTDEKQNVIRYDLINKRHRIIPNSKFPIAGQNDHEKSHHSMYGACARTFGVQIMDYYWIILGDNMDGLMSLKTSLWSMKKEKWIEGPNFQDSEFAGQVVGFEGNEICLVGVGNGEAYLLIDYRLVLGYNFYKNQWKNGTLPKLKVWDDYTWTIHQHSCVFYQNKNYERYLSLDVLKMYVFIK
mgnify:FL=1